ncbi:hypothetical protein VB620_00405 [Nodularia harveyana UHCC-0300]|uniref:Uncharacterized protein n=1 Tax=Nodularia harveyana UHCC-0300 TaxID=2974287 RepID=A0ABU5U8Y9_9CYAN|nr:hypothetical protein [Nodularia harveyana]MEA5579798.1 hypothetical protein [Nodularia harveyana UHCC-0300]
MKILDSPYTNTPHSELKKTPALESDRSDFLNFNSQFLQYVKTTLANLNGDGHEYFQ